MKSSFAALVLTLMCSFSSFSQVVSIVMKKDVITKPTNTDFIVRCASEQDLEIVVFTGEHLVLHQKSTLPPGDNPFTLNSSDMPAGKYFVLVTGNGIHVEKEFHLVDK